MPVEIPDEIPPDSELFPFGPHKNVPFGDVPASYFDFIHGQEWIEQWPRVLAYINTHRKYIDAELELEERAGGRKYEE